MSIANKRMDYIPKMNMGVLLWLPFYKKENKQELQDLDYLK